MLATCCLNGSLLDLCMIIYYAQYINMYICGNKYINLSVCLSIWSGFETSPELLKQALPTHEMRNSLGLD